MLPVRPERILQKIQIEIAGDPERIADSAQSICRLAEKLAVKMKTDRVDMTALLGADDVSRSADLKIADGKLKSRSEMGVAADCLHPPAGIAGHHPGGREKQIRIRLPVPPPDTAAQLMQFRKSEHVGPLDNHGVRVRDVDAGLDDGRTDKDVDGPVNKLFHNHFEFISAHLAVGDSDFCPRSQQTNLLRGSLNGMNPVVNIENLSAASEFPGKRRGDKRILLLRDHRVDRKPPDRRRGDRAQIPEARHRHVKRAGNRGRGHGQHVDCRTDRLELFLVFDAEPLFLVNDDQSEIAELDVGPDQGMSPDDNVD